MIKWLINWFLLLLLFGCTFTKLADDESCKIKNNDAAKANVRLALAFLKQGYHKDAKEKLLLAEQLDTREPSVWYSLGYFYERIGEYDLAKKNYEFALRVAPDLAAAHNNYGAFLYHMGDYQTAMKHFLIASQDLQYLNTGSAYWNAALCALKQSRTDLAKVYFQKAALQAG